MDTSTFDTPRSVGWICTSPSQFVTAKEILDIEHRDPSIKHDNLNIHLGRIGPVSVTISHIPPSLSSADIAIAVQSLLASSKNIRSILVTGDIRSRDDSNITPGDLIINAQTYRAEVYPESLPTERNLSQQAAILQKEVGDDGCWLLSKSPAVLADSPDSPAVTQQSDSGTSKYPRLHYRNTGQDNQNNPKEEIIPANPAQDFNTVSGVLESLTVDFVTILTAGKDVTSSGSVEEYSVKNAVSYAKELIQGLSDGLTRSLASVTGTERVVPPILDVKVPPFAPQQFPRHGDAVLLVIPTANKSKVKLLEDGFKEQKPNNVVLHFMSVPFDSGVGEQPYNEAGVLGAHTRISNAMRHVNTPECQEMLVSKGIGTVLLASIENFFQLDNVQRPTDYGLAVIHNAYTGNTTAGLSLGVTVPPAYVDRARRFGFAGNSNYGKVTVGQILAAHVPGLDKANFHGVLAGRSRYDLLSEVIGGLTIPW